MLFRRRAGALCRALAAPPAIVGGRFRRPRRALARAVCARVASCSVRLATNPQSMSKGARRASAHGCSADSVAARSSRYAVSHSSSATATAAAAATFLSSSASCRSRLFFSSDISSGSHFRLPPRVAGVVAFAAAPALAAGSGSGGSTGSRSSSRSSSPGSFASALALRLDGTQLAFAPPAAAGETRSPDGDGVDLRKLRGGQHEQGRCTEHGAQLETRNRSYHM